MTDPIRLAGCTSDPLMAYLKGVGVLRVVAEQTDAAARAAWDAGGLRLTSHLTAEDLIAFFRDGYAPTPILAPWGARTGFYDTPSEKTAREALEAIAATSEPRFAPYRGAIVAVRGLLTRLGLTKKPKEQEKLDLLRQCRAWLPESVLPWLDACYVLTTASRTFPPLLGTGGNDGSADFTSNFMQHVRTVLIDRQETDLLVRQALFGRGGGRLLAGRSPGQFDPGGVGGPNATEGFVAASLVNPWDYLLMLEGALLFAGAAARRFAEGRGGAAFPFTVQASASGYGSASALDETKASRAEIWMPLWSKPATLAEVHHLLAEGRAQVGRRQARTGVDFARAVAGIGVDRGIAAFQRYSLLQRSGRSYLATALGQIPVDGSRVQVADLLLEIDPWLDRLRATAWGEKAPARCRVALRQLERAIFEACLHGDPRHLQQVVIALGEAEAVLGTSLRFREQTGVRPLHHLSPRWLRLSDDRSSEFRLAAALASIREDRSGRLPALRAFLEPVRCEGRVVQWTTQDHAVAWTGHDPERDLAAVLERRMLDAQREGLDSLPVRGLVPASLAHVQAFLAGRVDLPRLARLVFGLATLRWDEYRREEHALPRVELPIPADLSRAYCLLKLVHLSAGLEFQNGRARLASGDGPPALTIRPDNTILRLLRAGRVPDACERASGRLRSAGVVPLGSHRGGRGALWEVPERVSPQRIAAALLFPIVNIEGLVDAVLRPAPLEKEEPS